MELQKKNILDAQVMDQEFTDLVNMAFDSDLRVEIIYETIKIVKEQPDSISAKDALYFALREWDK